MFKKHSGRRKTVNPLYVVFRLFLSLIIFALLLGGVYSAYKHFTGMDPLKLNSESVAKNLLKAKSAQDIIVALGSIKATEGLAQKINQKVLGDQVLVPADNLVGLKQTQSKVVLRFLMVADSHNDNINLAKALEKGKQAYPDIKFVLGLGDYSDVGTVTELKAAKQQFDSSSLRYFLIPGDHDLWDGRNRNLDPVTNFRQVFGPSYQSFTEGGFYFIMVYNSDNYLGLSEEQKNWLNLELEKAKREGKGVFVFVHEPLYHPSSDHAMGRVEPKLKDQAKTIIYSLKGAGVKSVVAGDAHYFSQYNEPETGIFMSTVGAVTAERNLQTPRYAIGEIMEDGSLRILDIEIK